MTNKKIDLTGQRFGRLKVLCEGEPHITSGGHRNVTWDCLCECGNKTNVMRSTLTSGTTQSCGCLQKDRVRKELTGKVRPREVVYKISETRKERYEKEGTNLSHLKQGIRSDNTSGIKGVSWEKNRKKWRAHMTFKGKYIHLGYFDNKQDAIGARKEAEEKYFKPILEKYKV